MTEQVHNLTRFAAHKNSNGSSSQPGTFALEPHAERVAANLLEAFGLLARRGSGALAWATPYLDDPIAFLLDSISDATSLWDTNGDLIYCNRAAAELGIGVGSESLGETLHLAGRRFERRCLRCHTHGVDYMLEIVHEIRPLSAENPYVRGRSQKRRS